MAKRKIIAPEAKEIKNRVNTIGDQPKTQPKDVSTPESRRALQRVDDRQKFTSIADQVARETMYLRNWRWPGGGKQFPDDIDAHMRFVTKYYPYAEGGPLLVDEPQTHNQIMDSYAKQKILKKLGFRMVVIEGQHYAPGSDDKLMKGSTYAEVMEQLDEDRSA